MSAMLMNQAIKQAALICIASVAFAGCATTPNVRYDADSKADVAQFHSVTIESVTADVREGGEAFRNPLNEQRLRDAVSDELNKRGLPAADKDAADTYVTIALGARRTVEPNPMPRVRFGFSYGAWRPGFGSSVYFMDDPWVYYREGRITIDWFDAKTRKPLWHASVEQDLTFLTKDNAETRINTLVAAMFAKFPKAAQ